MRPGFSISNYENFPDICDDCGRECYGMKVIGGLCCSECIGIRQAEADQAADLRDKERRTA